MLTPVTVEAGAATGEWAAEWVAALLTKIIIERKLGCD